jgi:exonuclease III
MNNSIYKLLSFETQLESEKRFSWWGPNKRQGRLDYFCISSDLEPFVVTSDIGISYKSDHSPVFMKLNKIY